MVAYVLHDPKSNTFHVCDGPYTGSSLRVAAKFVGAGCYRLAMTAFLALRSR